MGIAAALLLARLPRYRTSEPPPLTALECSVETTPSTTSDDSQELVNPTADEPSPNPVRRLMGWGFWGFFLFAAGSGFLRRTNAEQSGDVLRDMASFWLLPAIVAAVVLYGWVRRVHVYESLVEGAKEGFQVALRIIPYLVAILVAVGMFRASRGLDFLVGLIAPVTALIGMPGEALPMAMLRPLTGSGALGVATETMTVHGPDSLIGYMVSTYQGSTETTFYVLAVYFGAVGVKETRHTLPACLMADVTGILAATFIVNVMFG